MKKVISLLFVCVLSGTITLAGYKYFFENKVESEYEQDRLFELPVLPPARGGGASSIDFTAAAENTVNAVVHVKNLSYVRTSRGSLLDFFYGYEGNTRQAQVGTGSGVVITEDGYIVTNNHVIDQAQELEVTLNNNKTYKARLVGKDKAMDIALLKVDTEDKLPYLVFGDSDAVQLGEWVLAVGNPFNLTSTVTAGIVSAKARNLSKTGIQSFIQTDAAINPGNSGGALVNTRGELIGINTMISSNTGSYVGYAFAVPSNITKKIVEDILEYGNVQEGVLGVKGFELNTLLAAHFNTPQVEGFYVQGVEQNSGAEIAGLREGDVITAINGKKILTFVDIKSILNMKRPKDVVDVTFLRNDKVETIKVGLSKSEKEQITFHGFSFEELTQEEKEQLGIGYGLRIAGVDNQKYKTYKEALEGGVLLSVNGFKITSLRQVEKAFADNQRLKVEILTSQGRLIRLLMQ